MSSVSVIVPAYNCARFLPESLDSVVAQTRAPMEVIVVDDGSTDDTARVLASYGDRIFVVTTPHAGYAEARNAGLRRARGDWIAFHDADDVALPDRLAFQLDHVEHHPNDEALLCNGELMDAGGAAGDIRTVTPARAHACVGRALTARDLFDGFPAFFQGALLSRRAALATGEFDAALAVYADMDYAYRLFARVRAVFVDRLVFRYRRHDGNVTRDRLAGRRDIAHILEALAVRDQAGVREIGRRRLNRRLARHYYRIGRRYLELGDPSAARPALARAVRLQPLHPRYRLAHLLHGRVRT